MVRPRVVTWGVWQSNPALAETAASGLALYISLFVTALFKKGVIALPKGDEEALPFIKNGIRRGWTEIQEFIARSNTLVLMLIVLGQVIVWLILRMAVWNAMGIFNNMWVAGGVVALVISPFVIPGALAATGPGAEEPQEEHPMKAAASCTHSTTDHTGGTMDPIPKHSRGVTAIVIAGLALSGCSMLGGEREDTNQQSSKPQQLTIDGDFVFATATGDDSRDKNPAPATGNAPAVGDLFTMTVDGSTVTVIKRSGTTDAEGLPTPTVDARQTAFGELGHANSTTTAPISWLETGALADDDKSELALLSDGDMVKVGNETFFAADGTQGEALVDQFDGDCSATEDDETTETEDPTATSPDEPGQEP